MKALADAANGFPALAIEQAGAILARVKELEADPALFSSLQRRSLLERGLELIDGPECPLCDRAWDDEKTLRAHVKQKLAKSEQARKMQESLTSNGNAVAQEAVKVVSERRNAATTERLKSGHCR